MFYLKAGFHMIADRRSQIAIRSAIVCDHMETTSAIDRDLRSSQTIADLIAICDHMETSLKVPSSFNEINLMPVLDV